MEEGISDDDSIDQANTHWVQDEVAFRTGAHWRFGEPAISRGSAIADLDQDGLLDLIIGNIDAPTEVNGGTAWIIDFRYSSHNPPKTDMEWVRESHW